MLMGARLRDARKRQNLSLRALGKRTGFSASYLSQVELGQVSPSLGSLQRIAEAVGLTASGLVAGEAEAPGGVLRKSARASHHSEWSKATLESLVPASADEKLQAVLIRLEPGGKTGSMGCAPGRRLFAYCSAGEVWARLGEPTEELIVRTGDSVMLDGPRTSAWDNRTQAFAELLVVTARVG